MTAINPPTGLKGFTFIWAGQIVSYFGTAMTMFGLTIWAWEVTGKATALALVSAAAYAPSLLFSPLAGVFVDRWDRKLVMMFSDMGTALATITVLFLYATHNLQIWHLYIVALLAGTFTSFQFPAFTAAITLMVPKDHYARANAMIGVAQSIVGILAPTSAAFLLGTIGLAGIMVIDVLTFSVAFSTLLWVRVPQVKRAESGHEKQTNIRQEVRYGFEYILARPGLLGLQLVFCFGILFEALSITLISPMILAYTNGNERVLGGVRSVGAVGGILGGVLMSLWGGPKRKVKGMLVSWAISNVFGVMLMGLGKGFFVWVLANAVFAFLAPFVDGLDDAFWQSKVAPEVQGRVFANRMAMIDFANLFGMLLAGPLADNLFEPAMMPEGQWVHAFGWLVGSGPGAGMSLMLVLMGFLGTLIMMGGYLFRVVWNAEDLLPDHDTQATLLSMVD